MMEGYKAMRLKPGVDQRNRLAPMERRNSASYKPSDQLDSTSNFFFI